MVRPSQHCRGISSINLIIWRGGKNLPSMELWLPTRKAEGQATPQKNSDGAHCWDFVRLWGRVATGSGCGEAVNFLRTREDFETWSGTTFTIEWKFLPATQSPSTDYDWFKCSTPFCPGLWWLWQISRQVDGQIKWNQNSLSWLSWILFS
jgi:hypothetical protein